MALLTFVFALCPCLPCARMAADDCCASEGLSISGMCCADDSGSRTVVPSATALLIAPDLASSHPLAIDATAPVSAPAQPLPNRPIVARAVLRI